MTSDIDRALASLDRDSKLLDLVEEQSRHIARLHGEMAELRDELLALSNRIEAVTRPQVGSGLHSVKVTPRRVTRYCFECEHPRQFTEGKCDYCAAPLQQGAEAR